MESTLQKAIQHLDNANEKYKKACIHKFGSYIDSEKLYVAIVGPAWRAYLAAGGSPTMINS